MGPHIGESFGIDLDAPAHIRRAVLSTGFLGRADRSVSKAAGAVSCAVLAPACQPLSAGSRSRWLNTSSLALPLDA